jgi:hypothetical protein
MESKSSVVAKTKSNGGVAARAKTNGHGGALVGKGAREWQARD